MADCRQHSLMEIPVNKASDACPLHACDDVLAVGTTTPSLCRRTEVTDIRHFFHRYFRKEVLAF